MIKKLSLIKDEEEEFGWLQKITKLMPREEYRFLKDYKKTAIKQGLSLNPDDPKHYYDYRGLWKETGKVEPDETGHFSSKWKLKGHPDMYIEGVKTKEEEKPGWLQRTRGIGELPKYDFTKELKPEIEGKIGLEAKAKVDVFRPPKIKKLGLIKEKEDVFKPQISLGIKEKGFAEKPEDKPKTLLEATGFKLPTRPEELKMGIDVALGTWEEQKRANPELQKTEDLAREVLSMRGINSSHEHAQIAYIYELLTATPTKAGIPMVETIKDIQSNLEKYGSISPPKDWRKAFKEEGILKTALIGASDKYGKAESIRRGFIDILIRKESPGTDLISSMGWKGMVLFIGSQAVAGLMEVTPEVWRKLSVKVVDKKISFKEGLDAVFKVGHGEGTTYQRKIFDTTIKQADIKNISVINMLKKGVFLTEAKPRFAFGTKLYAGLPADEIVKVIIETGRVTTEVVKGLDPTKISQVIKSLNITSPALASELAKNMLIERGIKEEFITPEFLEKFVKRPEIQELPIKKVEKPELPEFVRRQIIEPTKEELAKIEAEKPLTAKEKFMAKMKEIVGIKPKKEPIELSKLSDPEQLKATIKGVKPIYLTGTENPAYGEEIKIAKEAGLKIKIGDEKPYAWDKEGNVRATTKDVVIYKPENEKRAIEVLETIKIPPEKMGEEYHRKLGRLLGYSEEEIKEFIEPVEPKEVDLTGAKQTIRGVLKNEGIPVEFVEAQIEEGKSHKQIMDWLKGQPGLREDSEIYTIVFSENLARVVEANEMLDIEAEVKPLYPKEEVTVDLVKEGKVKALWKGEDIGGTSEEITEGTLKAFEKTSIFLFDKPFSELKKAELNKVLEASKQPLPDDTGEYINKIGTPAKGLELRPMEDAHARFIFGGYTKEILTDSHLLVLDKNVSKAILTDIIEKYKKARVKEVQTDSKISYQEAQKIVDKWVKGYKKEFVKDFPKTEEIVTKEAIEKSTSLWIQGHQKTSDYTPTITYFTDGKIQIAIDTNKVAFLNKQFPNAEIKATGVDKPVLFMEKGKLKAIVMPVRVDEFPFKITGEPTIKPITKKIEKPIPKKLKDDYLKVIGREVELTIDHLELVEDIRHDIPISKRLQTSYPDLMKKIPEAKFAEIEVKPTIKKLAKIKPTVKPTITPEEKAERGRLIKKIHTIKAVKGLTDKEYTQIKRKIKEKFAIPWVTLTRMNIEQLQAVSKSMERARPKRIGYQKVITLKTEKKIQSLKNSLIEKFEMTEEVYEDTLKDLGIYKEPRYIDGKHFITEEKGKELIYRLIDESNILKITEPLRIALEKNPEVKKLADVIDKRVKLEGERTLKDPSDLNSARSYFQILETISDAPFFTLYQDLIDTHLENRAGLNHLINDFDEYRDIIKEETELKKVEDWILSESNLEGRPETPVNITPKEIKLAKKIKGILEGYQSRARTEKFLDNLDNLSAMPQYLQYKKEMDKAKDIYESKGYDELVKYLETQKWGIIRNGYDPLQVVSAKIRVWKAKGLSIIFGKEHIKVRKDIEYKEQDTNIITRVIAYKRQMDNLSVMAPKVRALITLANKNLDKFKNPDRVRSNLQLFFRELKGYDRSTGWFERGINRIYAQAMTTIIMGSPPLAFRNLGQNLGLGHDKAMLVDPRNKKLTPDEIVYLDTYVQQAIFMRTDWFMTGEKPLGFRIGKVQIGLERLTNLIKKINLYPRSDIANRLWGFWGKINQVKMAFADIDKNSTNKEISKAMGKAKFSDFSLLEQKRALEILSKDGKEEMERYIAKVYVDDVHFLYERAQRSLAEMGRYGRVFGNLMLFPRAYWEKLTKHSKKMTGKYVPIKERIRAFKVISSILIGGALVSVAYMKVTGRRKPPYDPLVLLAYQTGGLMIGTVDALNDVYVETILAVRGDRRALAGLTSSVPALADHFIPFYNYMLRGYEAFLGDPLVNKNIDVYALKKLRQLIDNEYKIRGGVHSVERNALEKWQYFLSGAGVDVAIAERKKKEKELEPIIIGKPGIPKLGIPTISKPGIKKLSPIKKF